MTVNWINSSEKVIQFLVSIKFNYRTLQRACLRCCCKSVVCVCTKLDHHGYRGLTCWRKWREWSTAGGNRRVRRTSRSVFLTLEGRLRLMTPAPLNNISHTLLANYYFFTVSLNTLLLPLLTWCVYVTVYRKTRHNAAPSNFFVVALTELSASRYWALQVLSSQL